jgi:hypothetical protein
MGRPNPQRHLPSEFGELNTALVVGRLDNRARRENGIPMPAFREGAQPEAGDVFERLLLATDDIARKAGLNKALARTSVVILTAATASIPVFIGLSGDDFILSKVVPSILAALSTLVTSLVQLERPHERWMLYRRYQRLLEALRLRYEFSESPFDADDRDRVLAGQVADTLLRLQQEWEGLVPTRGEVDSLGQR